MRKRICMHIFLLLICTSFPVSAFANTSIPSDSPTEIPITDYSISGLLSHESDIKTGDPVNFRFEITNIGNQDSFLTSPFIMFAPAQFSYQGYIATAGFECESLGQVSQAFPGESQHELYFRNHYGPRQMIYCWPNGDSSDETTLIPSAIGSAYVFQIYGVATDDFVSNETTNLAYLAHGGTHQDEYESAFQTALETDVDLFSVLRIPLVSIITYSENTADNEVVDPGAEPGQDLLLPIEPPENSNSNYQPPIVESKIVSSGESEVSSNYQSLNENLKNDKPSANTESKPTTAVEGISMAKILPIKPPKSNERESGSLAGMGSVSGMLSVSGANIIKTTIQTLIMILLGIVFVYASRTGEQNETLVKKHQYPTWDHGK